MSLSKALRTIISSTHSHHNKIRNFCSSVTISKDTKQTSPDILLNKFKHATSTSEVLDTFSQHKDVMNIKHIMQALRSVFVLQKEGRSDLSTKSIISSRKFAQLCEKLKTLAGIIEPNETIEALKIVTYVGVPKNSTIVLVLLQLLRHNLNDLNLQQIIFLDFLLGNYSGVPLAEALKIALPIVFDIQLPIKMERENIQSLKEYLHYASKHQLSNQSVDLILSKTINCQERYDAKTAKSIIWSICDMRPRPCFEKLLKKNVRVLTQVLDELPFKDVDITLKKLMNSYTKYEYAYFRNEEFCNAVACLAMDKNLSLDQCIYVMKKLEQLDVINKSFIDFVFEKISEDLSKIDDLYYCYVILKYMAKTDYRPENWDEIIIKIKDSEKTKIDNIESRKLALALCYHQIFDNKIIDEIFNNSLEKNLTNRDLIRQYLTVYYSLKLHRPELVPKNFKPENYLELIDTHKEFPLEGALFSAFGGEKYVKTGVYSKEGIFIDHMIIFRKGGYPVSTNYTSKFIEDLDISEDNEIVLVMCLHPEAYTKENYLLKANSFRLELLEKLGYTVVPMCLESWNSLLDHEKIPYLVQNIKNKLQQDITLNTYG